MDSQIKLKRVVIKEELVILTGDYIKALILNQFLYWSERTKDFDKFIREEKERFSPEDEFLNMQPTFGWIYKTADELSKELMLGVSGSTIRRHLTKLIKSGWIDQRHNPNHKWDRTLQYRPNIINIQTDLEAMGYSLEGYPLLQNAFFKIENGTSKMKNRTTENEGALPETTTEITTDINGSAKNSQKSLSALVDPSESDILNDLADQVSQVCKIDIATASPKTREALKVVTLALNTKNVTKDDLKSFGDWWYNQTWQGKKGQVPTPGQLGDMWGQFEAQKTINTPSLDLSGGFHV